MGWQVSLEEAKRQAAERAQGRQPLWWVYLDEPARCFWATTRESDDGWTLMAWLRTLVGNRVAFEVVPTTDARIACLMLENERELVVVDEHDMPDIMRTLRSYGHHGRYRKAGTGKDYRF